MAEPEGGGPSPPYGGTAVAYPKGGPLSGEP